MNHTSLLEALDPEISGRLISRRDALRGAGRVGAGVALASVPLALGTLAKSAFGQGGLPQPIVEVLNFALTLEYLEDEFYRTGLDAPAAIAAEDREVFETIRQHEAAHVEFLQGVLGASAVPKPTFDFTAGGAFADVFTNPATFLALSQGFEDTGVRAYKGRAPDLISNDTVLTAALTIHSVEARHASEVRRIRGQKGWITGNQTDVAALAAVYAGEENSIQAGINLGGSAAVSEAFDEPLAPEAVLAIAGLFIVS